MRTALVTGANQNIGFALVEQLAARWDPTDLVLLTGRHAGRVADAVARAAPAARSRIEGRVLDVTDTEAVAKLAAEFTDGIDVVVSNAVTRMTPDRQAQQTDEFINVANRGAHAVLRSFGPVLRPGGRLVVVASSLGTLDHLPASLHHLFDNVPLDAVEQAVESWRTAIHNGTAARQGWPEWVNVPSKVAQVAAVRAVAAERRTQDLTTNTLIAAICPGLVDTPTSRPWFDDFSFALTTTEAAKRALDFILTNPVNPALYGELVRFGRALPWKNSG